MCEVMCERSIQHIQYVCVRSIKSFKNWAEKGLDPEENGLSDSELVWCAQTRFRPKS
jgi:hypothetical protein